ncbi:MAG TPA: MCP four helix bundle domain-containing protein, partial [Fibrobacteria bacterium]|nr:MCP four helix bundle domain-containing protein [Fibrobacteria bacterium]
MSKGFSLSAKLYLGFGSVLVISAALGVFAFTRLLIINKASAAITQDCLPGILSISKVNSLAKDNLRWTNGVILADTKAEVAAEEEKIKANVLLVEKSFKEYEASIVLPKDRELFEATKAPLAEFRSVRNEVVALAEEGKKDEAEAMLKTRLRPAFQKFEESINALVDFNVRNSDDESVKITAAIASAKTGIALGLLLAMALGASIGIFLSRSISNALNRVINSLTEGSEQVSSASTQVSQSSQQMAEGAS